MLKFPLLVANEHHESRCLQDLNSYLMVRSTEYSNILLNYYISLYIIAHYPYNDTYNDI